MPSPNLSLMASIFTMIINGDLPGRFVWRDDVCAAFLTIAPLAPGHTLVVPREEVEHWIDLDAATSDHLFGVAKTIGAAINDAYSPEKVGLMIAGLEVAHTHLHVLPINDVHDLDFANADVDATAEDLDAAAEAVRTALAGLGYPYSDPD